MYKKICFVVPGFNNGGGTERVTSQIANRFSKNGYRVSILSLSEGKQPVFEINENIELLELNCQWQALKDIGNLNFLKKAGSLLKRILIEIRISFKLKKKLGQLSPDIVIVSDIAHYSKVAYGRKKFKTIAWELFCLEMRQNFFINYSRKLAAKYASKIIVQGDSDCLAYQKKYPKANNITRIYNASSFPISNTIDADNKVVVAAGRYSAEKGFDMLIEIWNKISVQVQDWELRIFGEGDERQKLQKLIDDNPTSNIKLCGFTKSLDKEMEQASIYAMTSKFEGFGMVLVEAQSKGLPIISFDIKHGPNLIVDDGVNGFLIPAFDMASYEEKLLSLIKNKELRKEFSNNSQKDLWRFDIEIIAKQWIELVETI